MKKLVLSAMLILFVGFGSLLQLSSYVHDNVDFKNNPYIRLVPPPPEALASDYGTPLVTVDIGLFAYYEAADWDLNDVIPAFHNYTQYGNYVDGYVRVWYDVNETVFVGTEGYIDVSVRVRSDGWILAWIEDTQEKQFIAHVGGDLGSLDYDVKVVGDYETCLSRAMYRVYHNAGVSWIGYDAINYYDYEFPDATRLAIFGVSSESSTHFYFVVPSSVSIEACWVGGGGYSVLSADIQLDSVNVLSHTSFQWFDSADITGSVATDTKHDVYLEPNLTYLCIYILLWTS